MNSFTLSVNGVTLQGDAFGQSSASPVLLIMGAMMSGRWWPDEFCQQLADGGCYVIRYDHRDTGQSTSYAPGTATYTAEDLADDAAALLTALGLDRAHVAGMSLGGYLAQLIALKYPRRVLTLTLIASEPLAPSNPAVAGIAPEILDYHAKSGDLDWTDRAAVIAYQVGAWRLLTGPGRSFDAATVAAIAGADFDRTPNPLSAFNHAGLGETAGWLGRMDEIKAPALIVHGTEDKVLPYAHALALKAALKNASLLTLEGAGHELNRADWDVMIDALLKHTALPRC